jgi:hypothetical protein
MIRYLCLLAVSLASTLVMAQSSEYAGSVKCKACHADTYARWSKTRMANVIVDPKLRPEAIIPDKLEDVAFTYGSKWKQRYFKKVGDDYFPFPAQWDVANKVWRAYNVKAGTDWWTPHYGADNMQRPTGPLCHGCHSVNYNVQTKVVTEWNVGCESLIFSIDAFNILNRTNYSTYIGSLSSSFFGRAVSAQPPRRLQLGARFQF